MTLLTSKKRAKAPAPTPAAADVKALEPDAASFRTRREAQLTLLRQRRATLARAAPHASQALLTAVASSEAFWGPDQKWRSALRADGHNPVALEPSDDSSSGTSSDPVNDEEAAGEGAEGSSPTTKRRRPRVKKRPATTNAAETTAEESAAPLDHFDIPAPGGRTRTGLGRAWITRLVLVAGPLFLIGGVAYSCGVGTGSSRVVVPPVITPDVAEQYRLSTFPLEQAAAFGSTYLTICLTHPDVANQSALINRGSSLSAMTSAGVAPGCGWDGKGPAQQPVSVTFAGTHTSVDDKYPAGTAEQLDFTAVMQDGRALGLSLPIWASQAPEASRLRVVGDVALMPALEPTTVPVPSQPRVLDATLSSYLTPAVLQPFFVAWAASDPVQLALIVTTDASSAARQGMTGQVSDPRVDTPTVEITSGDPKGYRDGDTATARTAVTWTTPAGQQRSTYSVDLRLVANRWLVVDITGGPVDPRGGAAPSATFAATPTTTPPSS